MSRVWQSLRAPPHFHHSLKRHRERRLSERSSSSESPRFPDDLEHRIPKIVWKLAFGQLNALRISVGGETTLLNEFGVTIGAQRDSITFEENVATFTGSKTTMMKIQLAVSTNKMTIMWFGKRLYIDDTYAMHDGKFTVWQRSPCHLSELRPISITAEGENVDSLTLWHCDRSYIVRFEENYPAMVVPRCTYFPMKLTLMKDFVNQFMPRQSSAQSPRADHDPVDEQNVPEASPQTPRGESEPSDMADPQTPPSQCISNERAAQFRESECSNDDDTE